MERNNLDKLVLELCKLPDETGWVEFKQNNWSPEVIGEDISALANSAVLAEKSYAYMIWGVEDSTHKVVGTTVRLKELKKGKQELENWLRYLLSNNADFEFHSTEIDGKHVEIMIVAKAQNIPVTFEKVIYIRSGSYTKKLQEFPVLQAQLWDRLRRERFEDTYAVTDLTFQRVLQLLNCDTYFDIMHLPLPTDKDGYEHYLCQEEIIVKQDNGLFAITNLGAILFARRLSDFRRLERKAIRVVQYADKSRMSIVKEQIFADGYAKSLESAVRYVFALLPATEDINAVRLTTESTFPLPAVRESIANAVIHQDLYATGAGPVAEVFSNRIEVTNPGTPMIDVMRILDNPPRSRNEKLASLMRRLKMCEELGRGWDRMVLACEKMHLPAPNIHVYEDATKVTMFSHIDFNNIPAEDKMWCTYLHACLKYIEGESLSTASLRERFKVEEKNAAKISRLIKDTVAKKLIKPLDPDTAPRYMRYIPTWA